MPTIPHLLIRNPGGTRGEGHMGAQSPALHHYDHLAPWPKLIDPAGRILECYHQSLDGKAKEEHSAAP